MCDIGASVTTIDPSISNDYTLLCFTSCAGYKNGTLQKISSAKQMSYVSSSEVKCNANEFRSRHSLMNSASKPLITKEQSEVY